MREVALKIDETNRSIDTQINDIQQECDEIRRMIDSRIDKLENKFGKTNKEIIKG
jgi:flagellar capping protein FliD